MEKRNKRFIGAVYETKAAGYLEERGYQILKKNYHCRAGEIDLIAMDGGQLVFCEVKYRKDEKNGHPLEAVDRRKQRTISRCALYYMTEHGFEDLDCRFDVVGIFGEEITLIRNAFAFSSF